MKNNLIGVCTTTKEIRMAKTIAYKYNRFGIIRWSNGYDSDTVPSRERSQMTSSKIRVSPIP